MHNITYVSVTNLWVVCVLIGLLYPAIKLVESGLCRNDSFVRKSSTTLAQLFPHVNNIFNRVFLNFSLLSTRPIRATTSLYNLITINSLEKS